VRLSAVHSESGEERLVERHVPYARALARRAAWRFQNQDFDDLYSDALLGLLSAARRYRPGPVPFLGFARPWIHGEMLKGIRHRTGARSDRKVSPPKTVSLDAPSPEGMLPLAERLPDASAPSPFEEARTAELWAAVSALPTRTRLIVRLYHEWGLSQGAIADLVGVSQMHVSRLLQAAYEELHGATPA
jgi:RNA polymerase sigma factor (sigma-70 family)